MNESAKLSSRFCSPASLADINLQIGQVKGYTNPVTLSVDSLPTGFTAGFTVSPVNPPGNSLAQISVDAFASAVTHYFQITGTGADATDRHLAVKVAVFDEVAAVRTHGRDDAASVERSGGQ